MWPWKARLRWRPCQRPKERRQERPADAKPKKQPPYAVIVFNDEEHTFEYVIETLMKVFGYRGRRATR